MGLNIQGVSNIGIFARARQDLSRVQSRLAQLQFQISSNRRLTSIHDDVSATARVVRLQRALEQQDTFSLAIDQSRSRLEQTDNILAEINSLVIGLQAEVVNTSDNATTAEDKLAVAQVVTQTLESLVQQANTKIADFFSFAGFNTKEEPFVLSGNEVIFNGTDDEILSQISQGQFIASTLNPETAFGPLTVEKQGTTDLNLKLNLGPGAIDGHTVTAAGTATTFTDSTLIGLSATDLIGQEVYVSSGTNSGENGTISAFNPATGLVTIDAADAFNAAFDTTSVYSISQIGDGVTPLSSLNQGSGVEAGKIKITTTEFPTGTTIDLTTATTIADVRERIENVSSRLTVTLNANSNGFVITDSNGTSITIESLNDATTAEDLGINGTNASGVITGTDVDPSITNSSLISDLVGAVNDPLTLGSIHVVNGVREDDIDLSSATTVGELLTLINTAKTSNDIPFQLKANINSDGTSINIQSNVSGADFAISLFSATDLTATDLGLLTLTGTTTVNSLRNGEGLDISTNGADFTITDSVTGVQSSIDLSNVTTVQEIVNAINTQGAASGVTASINNVSGNKIQIIGTNPIFIQAANSNAAQQLGFALGTTATTLQGTDIGALKADSLFSSVSDFLVGLQNNDVPAIKAAGKKIDSNFDQLLQGRAQVGGLLTRLELTENRNESTKLLLTEELSNDLDTDLTETIAELTETQLALEVAFATSSRILDLTLFRFL